MTLVGYDGAELGKNAYGSDWVNFLQWTGDSPRVMRFMEVIVRDAICRPSFLGGEAFASDSRCNDVLKHSCIRSMDELVWEVPAPIKYHLPVSLTSS